MDKAHYNRKIAGNNITMKNPFAPGPLAVLADLAPIVPTISHCLEAASYEARAVFGERTPEAAYHASTLRYQARIALTEAAQQTDEFVVIDTPNDGLYLRFDRYHLKIWKARYQQVPSAGHSWARRIYLSQGLGAGFQPPLFSISDMQLAQGNRVNLVLLWDVAPNYDLSNLYLAYPIGPGGILDVAEVQWIVTVPEEMQLGTGTVANASNPQEVDVDDLVIERIDSDVGDVETGSLL